MSIFSRLRGAVRERPAEATARAVLTPAVSTMVADGSIDRSELTQLCNVCSFSPIFFQTSQKELEAMVGAVIDEIRRSGHDATIAAAARGLSPALRETALCFAMRIAFADGRVEEGERNSLARTATHMEIAMPTFEKIIEVVAMMQRPPNA